MSAKTQITCFSQYILGTFIGIESEPPLLDLQRFAPRRQTDVGNQVVKCLGLEQSPKLLFRRTRHPVHHGGGPDPLLFGRRGFPEGQGAGQANEHHG